MRAITKGSTDQSVDLYIVDNTTGLPATGLAFNSSGIDLWYRRAGAALTSITEATQTAGGAHSDGGFVHIANGVYRLDPPDAAFASGVDFVTFGGTITGYTVYPVTVQLLAANLQDAVRAGLTALPNANAEASGGLFTRGTGAGQINQAANGMADVNVVRNAGTAITATSGRQEVNVSHFGGTAGTFASGIPAAALTGESLSTAERYVVKYDGAVTGNLPTTFTRNKASVDGAGKAVAADERRFEGPQRAVVGPPKWSSTGYVAGASPYLMAAGRDLDGTQLLAMREDAGSTFRILSLDSAGQVKEESRIAWNSFPGGGGSVAYTPKSVQIFDGTILVYLQRQTSSVYDGITFVYSQDKGATWTRITNSAADGGGLHVSPPTAYSTHANTTARGGFWSTTMCPHGGIDAAGRPVTRNRMWFTWADYLIATSGFAKGVQMGIVELTRDSEDEHFTVGVNRVVWGNYWSSHVSTIHVHCLGMMKSGLMFAQLGDTSGSHSSHAISIDLDSYATATPTVTEVHGELAIGESYGRMTPQLFGGCPAPGGGLWMGNDTWPSPVMHLKNMETAASAVSLDSPIFAPKDTRGGNYYSGWENFNVPWCGGDGWTCGADSTMASARWISYDGVNWGNLPGSSGISTPFYISGDYLVGIRNSDDALVVSPKPRIVTLRPLLLAPGADNYVTAATTHYQASAPTSPNTVTRAYYSGGRWLYVATGLPVPNAPKSPVPNCNGGMAWVLGNENTASNWHGYGYLSDVGDNITVGSNVIQADFAIANCSLTATGTFQTSVGISTGGTDRTPDRGWQPDRTASADWPWCPGAIASTISSASATPSRALMLLQSGVGGSSKDCLVLVAVKGLYLGARTPWPVPPDSTGNNHEKEIVNIPTSSAGTVAWTGTVSLIRSELQATLSDQLPDGPLFTWRKDANNFIVVAWNAANWRVTVTPTVGGVAQSAVNFDVTVWPRGSATNVSISDDGTDLRVSVSQLSGDILTSTIAGDSIGRPTQLLFGDDDQSDVSNLMVAGLAFTAKAKTLQQMADDHLNLDYLMTADDKTAETVAAKVDAQLEAAFAALPANVWLQPLPAKSGTAGLRLAEGATAAEGAEAAAGEAATFAQSAATDSNTAATQTTAPAIQSAVEGAAPAEPFFENAPSGGGGDPVAVDVVDDSRTWFATDYRARNIITVGDNFEGTFALQPDLNPGTTILTVDSVSITGAATVTATDLSLNRSKTRAHFTVPTLTTTGTYTVVVTVTTVDGQTIPTTATLKVQ